MGFRGKYRNRRDANEPLVVETLEKFGFSVERLDTPADLLVGHGGMTWLVEVKQPKGRLNEKQSEFAREWKGHFAVIRSAEEAAEWARSVKDEADTWRQVGDLARKIVEAQQ